MDVVLNPVKEAICTLENLRHMKWYLCKPASVEAASVAPSGSNTHFKVDMVSAEGIPNQLLDAVANVFKTNAHQESYWKEFAIDTEMSISSSVVGYRGSQLESHVREYLLSPVLSIITKRMTLLPDTTCGSFKSYLQPEATVKLHDHVGRRASVDYVICLESHDHVLRCIPVEAKKEFSSLYVKQLSSYINKLSTCSDLQASMLIGLLLTETNFYFAFSPYKWSDDSRVAPIVYVSPAIEWRSPRCVVASGLLLMSVVHLISMPRISYPDPDDGTSKVLQEVTDKLYEAPYEASPSSSYLSENTTYLRLAFLQKQQQLIAEQAEELKANDLKLHHQQALLEEKDKELEARTAQLQVVLEEKDKELEARTAQLQVVLEEKDKELEKKINDQQEQIDELLKIVSPKKRK